MARTLVVYFSLTGHTKQVAEAIATKLHADIEPINDAAGRTFTPPHMVWFAMEALMHRPSDIHPARFDPADYDLVIVGTPVWAGQMSPPVRTYLDHYSAQFKRLAVFCTEGGVNGEHALKEMTDLARLKPQAELIVNEQELSSGAYKDKVNAFTDSLASARTAA